MRFILRATHFVVDSISLRVDKRATPTQIGVSEMEKLLAAFVTNPTDANRKRLQSHLQKHMMAICLATPAQVAFLTANGFKL